MTRVNRPDTLLTRLREIERRLRLLEGGRVAPAATLAAVASQAMPVAFTPARPVDWPGTDSPEWTDLVRAIAASGRYQVLVDTVAAEGTSGQARVVVNGTPAGEAVPADDLARHVVDVHVEDEPGEIVIQVRRVQGDGVVRTSAILVSRSG